MKTERRHALQTNWLADHLGRWLEKIKPYTNHILIGMCLVAAGWAIWGIVGLFSKADEERAWNELQASTSQVALVRRIIEETSSDSDALQKKNTELQNLRQTPLPPDKASQDARQQKEKELTAEIKTLQTKIQTTEADVRASEHEKLCKSAEKNIQTVAGRAAAFTAASQDFAEGARSLLTDPAGARKKLDRAADLFSLVRKHTRDNLERQRAQLELARLYETRLKRDPQHGEEDDIVKAKREYESLAKQVPESYCKREAERRLAAITAAIEAPDKQPFFVWMSRDLARQIEEGGKAKPPSTPVTPDDLFPPVDIP